MINTAIWHALTPSVFRGLAEQNVVLSSPYDGHGSLEGWRYFDSPRRFPGDYGTQKGWERIDVVNEDVNEE